MNLRLASLASLPLLLSFAAFAAAQTQAPALTPPPIKMGLWQSSVTVNMGGMPNMPAGAGGSYTHVNQSCMTPDSWKNAFRSMQQHHQQTTASCTAANVNQDAHQVTVDMDCSGEQGYATSIHVKMVLDSEEAMHGNATVKMTGSAFPQGMSMNSTITSKFVNADCGDVKPGESKPVQP
jgi:hypothetical protein